MTRQRVIGVDAYKSILAQGGKVSMGRPNKYHAISVTHEGVTYASKSEFGFKLHLDHLKALGIVAWYTRQVPFYLPGEPRAMRYVIDYLIHLTPAGAGTGPVVRLVDVKGRQTANSATKRSVIQATHGVAIELVPGDSKGRYSWR